MYGLDHGFGQQFARVENAADAADRDLCFFQPQFFYNGAGGETEFVAGLLQNIGCYDIAVLCGFDDKAGETGDTCVIDLRRIDGDDQIFGSRCAKLFGGSVAKCRGYTAAVGSFCN